MFFLIFKRFVLGLITLFIVSLITFIGVEILPGDACTSYLEREAFGEALAACIKRLGLDVPAHERYIPGFAPNRRGKPYKEGGRCESDV